MHSCTLSNSQQLSGGARMQRVGVKGEVSRQRRRREPHTACSRDCSPGPLSLPPSSIMPWPRSRMRLGGGPRVKKSEGASSGPLVATFSLRVGGAHSAGGEASSNDSARQQPHHQRFLLPIACGAQHLARTAIGRSGPSPQPAPVRILLESETVSAWAAANGCISAPCWLTVMQDVGGCGQRQDAQESSCAQR